MRGDGSYLHSTITVLFINIGPSFLKHGVANGAKYQAYTFTEINLQGTVVIIQYSGLINFDFSHKSVQ